jgi:hypothetical protein
MTAMELIDTINIRGRDNARIELAVGDLANLGREWAFDALVVSAFPGDYTPTPRSLIGALHRRGLSVADLAVDKDIDIRRDYATWLSKPSTEAERLNFGRVIGFEPRVRGTPPTVVRDLFRALVPIATVRPDLRAVGMPIVAAGDQGYGVETILRPLMDAAIHWLEAGLPLTRLTIVVRSETSTTEAARVFAEVGQSYAAPVIAPSAAEYDVFISYAHADSVVMDAFVEALRAVKPDMRIWVDRQHLKPGAAWQLEIFESIEQSRIVAALLSPGYLASKVCKEELSIGWIRDREADGAVLFPILALSASLPAFVRHRQYFDAREAEPMLLRAAAQEIVRRLEDAA